MENSILLKLSDYFDNNHIKYEKDYSLKKNSSFRIGGNATIAVFPSNKEEFKDVLSLLIREKIDFELFGNTTNILFDDNGLDKVAVFSTSLKGLELLSSNTIYAECGVSMNALCRKLADNSLSGGEGLYGIPGTIGGAIYMNAGAFECNISSLISSVEVLNGENGEVLTLENHEMCFGYRHSICFEKPYYILSAILKAENGNKEDILEKMECNVAKRKNTQPLEYPSAGSVFKRCAGHYTGKMIEESGLKGYHIGDAEVSTKHAGFIINKGNAKSEDVKQLIEYIQSVIKKNYDLDLECEVIFK